MPLLLKHGNQPEYRDEVVCKFSATFTVRKSIFSDGRFWSIFVIFSSFFVTFRNFSIVCRRGSVRNRSELFAAKIREPATPERAVHMCGNGQYRSLPRGAVCTFFGRHELAAFSGGPDSLPDDPDSKSVPIAPDPSRPVLELFQQSCPAIEGDATQSAQNLTSLGIQCGQEP